jgi:hypothetical protein
MDKQTRLELMRIAATLTAGHVINTRMKEEGVDDTMDIFHKYYISMSDFLEEPREG